MQPLPLDTESFEKMRTAKEPMLYVDKTAYLHRLVTDGQSRNSFLARPRRFGKSLMITTLEAIFRGRRELFKGLAIDRTDCDWKVHPVIHFVMSFCAADKPVWNIGLSFDSKPHALADHCVARFA